MTPSDPVKGHARCEFWKDSAQQGLQHQQEGCETCALMQARKAKEEAWQEQQQAAAEKRLSWKQKEKRKREQGQAKGGKGNYVEEEKRVAREFGVYSGFDT